MAVGPVLTLKVDQLTVQVYADRRIMGEAAAAWAAEVIRDAIASRGSARVAFASAPSQNEFLDALVRQPNIDWAHVTAFQLDEYVGLPSDAPQAFGRFLQDRLFQRVRPGAVHFLNGVAPNLMAEARRYAGLLSQAPLDLACTGIGENGHLAFNEPHAARFDDEELVRVVELDERSRRQQVHDGCFRSVEEVPVRALTLTIPAILNARAVVCVVPGPTKRAALYEMLSGPISSRLPASALRLHAKAVLFADQEAASEVQLGLRR